MHEFPPIAEKLWGAHTSGRKSRFSSVVFPMGTQPIKGHTFNNMRTAQIIINWIKDKRKEHELKSVRIWEKLETEGEYDQKSL